MSWRNKLFGFFNHPIGVATFSVGLSSAVSFGGYIVTAFVTNYGKSSANSTLANVEETLMNLESKIVKVQDDLTAVGTRMTAAEAATLLRFNLPPP